MTIISPFLERKANESPQRMAWFLAHFHRNRNRRVTCKAKWVRKAPDCKKLSNPVRHQAPSASSVLVGAEGRRPWTERL